jgi:GT2 family glycosyltransferase
MIKKERLISIVIPNYNGSNIIEKCLDCVFSQNYNNFEIILVDDFSSDNSLEKIKKYKTLKVIKNKKNLGFAGSCAIGSKNCSGELILFLNTDAFLIDTTTFSEINSRFEKNKNLNILGFTQVNKINETDFLGSEIDIFFNINSFDKNRVKKYTMVGGACFATRKNIYNNLGGIDSTYFLYVEEVDYMFRSLKSGYETEVSDVKVVHLGGGSTKNEYDYTTNVYKVSNREYNSLVSIFKNFDLLSLSIVTPLWLFFYLLEIVFLTLTLRFKYLEVYLLIFKKLLLNLRGILKKRAENFKVFKITDFQLLKMGYILPTNLKIIYIYFLGIPKFK